MSDLLLYGAIGWDIDALSTVKEISASRGKPLSVRINSPGGSVWDGLAIANAIKRHGDVTTVVDGLAASMGSIDFVAGKYRVMTVGSQIMIHNPASIAGGEAKDLRKEAGVLDTITDEMAKIYSEATGGKVSIEKAREMMDAETWLTPSEAIDLGFAHAIEGRATAWAKIPQNMKFRNQPQEITAMDPNTTEEPGLLERMLGKLTGTETMKADITRLESALTEAVGRVSSAEARATELAAALESSHAAHAAALAEAVAAAKIEGAQEFAAHSLKASAPDPVPHVEEGDLENFPTHTAKETFLRESGRLEEAAAYYSAHKNSILVGE